MSRESFARSSAADMRISAPLLTEQVAALFEHAGCSCKDAGRVAESLVLSNLLGHDSHGVSLIPLYIRTILEKKINTGEHATIRQVSPGMIAVDSDRMLGQVSAYQAMQAGIDEVHRHGFALVALRDSHHVGRIGEWAEQCAAAGFASLHLVNVVGSDPVVAPYGGIEARLHTNPIAVGIPRSPEPPLILDFATSSSAQGKMRILMARGEPAPDGYLIDHQGRPTRDPAVVYASDQSLAGALLPFGEHKGFGLGLVCDLLCGAVAGARSLHRETIQAGTYINNMVSFIFDMDRLSDRETRSAEMNAAVNYVQSCLPSVDGPVRLPGDGGRAEAERRTRNGIPIDKDTWKALDELFLVHLGKPLISDR